MSIARDRQGQCIPNSNKNSKATFENSNKNPNAMFANFNMNSYATFAMTHFVKLYYNVFILENKIGTPMFREICVNMCYIMLEVVLVCINMERVFFELTLPFFEPCPYT